ncbi:MAG: Y4oB family protein [Legionellales bacterium]|nr:Y4oB family protein [Legionellales bacterium]
METNHSKIVSSNIHQKSKVALKAFFGICEQWKLNTTQCKILLGNPPARTFSRWKQLGDNLTLSQDKLERISYILGIYKALRILLPNEEAANSWIHKPNSAEIFNGQSALDKLLQGRVIDLADVRRYLDAERGW